MTEIWRKIAAAYTERSYYLVAASGLLITEAEANRMSLGRRAEERSA
ncbi:hypothetical protein [Agreia sp.]